MATFDTSFTTDRIYQVHRTEFSFELREQRVHPPLRKTYPLNQILSELSAMDFALIAALDSGVVGFVAVRYEAWNRRAILQHLYVTSQHRGCGIGKALLKEVLNSSRLAGARCLWVETQNINYGAIQFYRRAGFRFCGLDESLYDQESAATDEIALFFVRELGTET